MKKREDKRGARKAGKHMERRGKERDEGKRRKDKEGAGKARGRRVEGTRGREGEER